jgi:hypothetical protein
MKTFDLFGLVSVDIADEVGALGIVLGLNFERHESGFWGDYFRADTSHGGSARLIENFDGESWRESDFQQFPWLLELNNIAHPNSTLETLLGSSIELFPISRTEVGENKARKFVWMEKQFILTVERSL